MNLNLPAFLDIAIGFTFIYLILSLLASEIQEFIAALFQWRSRHLKQSIYILLGGSGKLSDLEKLVNSDHTDSKTSLKDRLLNYNEDELKAYILTYELYQSSIIASLSDSTLGFPGLNSKTQSKPSYISSDVFAIALIEVLRKIINNQNGNLAKIKDFLSQESLSENGTSILPQRLKYALYELATRIQLNPKKNEQINPEIYLFQKEIEVWFDRSQNRTSGTYKRKTKISLLLVGFITAIVANANTFRILDSLYHQQTVRNVVTQAAVKAVNCQLDSQVSGCIDKIKMADQLPIGWISPSPSTPSPANSTPQTTPSTAASTAASTNSTSQTTSSKSIWFYLINLLGYALSGLAITMGAPFWFDLLNKFVNVRNAGPRPPSSTGN